MVNHIKRQVDKTTSLIVGTVGLGVAGAAGAGIPGMAGTIVRTGALPMAGLGLMADAAPSGYSRAPRRKRRTKRYF